MVNPELLATEEYANLLKPEEVKEIVSANTSLEKDTISNFKNVIDPDGEQNNVLKKAYKRFQKLDDKHTLKKNYADYVEKNKDWLNFERMQEADLGFYKFKQFLADEHLKKGKEALNSKGIKLAGDCLIGFSKDEVKAFGEAFKKDHFIGMPEWNLPALNYDTILDENSASAKLLKQKVQLFAKRYDIIRFDVGWAYVTPIVTPAGQNAVLEENRVYLNDSLLNLIEKWVKEVKGEKFDTNNLIYEFDAGVEEFKAFEGSELIQPLKNRVKIYGSTYMHNNDGQGWGYNKAFLNKGWSPDEYILGVGNHDPQPLRQIAEDIPEKKRYFDSVKNSFVVEDSFHKKDAIKPLSEELKISAEELKNPKEFAKAKFAEPMMSKNNQYFYMDVFGRKERFDMQGFNTTIHPEKNYAYKVPENFDKAYHSALEEGFGFNVADSLEKVFKAKGYDKTHPKLYEKIVKYRKILDNTVNDSVNEVVNNTGSKSSKSKIIFGVCAGVALLTGLLAYNHKKAKSKNLEFSA